MKVFSKIYGAHGEKILRPWFRQMTVTALAVMSLTPLCHATYYMADPEGNSAALERFMQEGLISFDESGRAVWKSWEPFEMLGDIKRRGPRGLFLSQVFDQLLTDAQAKVEEAARKGKTADPHFKLILGNHEFNELSFQVLKPGMKNGFNPEFEQWLQQRGKTNDLVAQVEWFCEIHGLNDKLQNMWIELAALSAKQDANAFAKKLLAEARLASGGDTKAQEAAIERALSALVGKDKLARYFDTYTAPGGQGWRLLEKGRILSMRETTLGYRSMSFHSGVLNEINLGAVPGTSVDLKTSDSIKAWEEGLQRFKAEELKAIASGLEKIQAIEKEMAAEAVPGKRGMIQEHLKSAVAGLENLQLRFYGDAGWDSKVRRLVTREDSLVYPRKETGATDSFAAVPKQKVVDQLAAWNVLYVNSGHIPVGDGPVVKKALASNGKVIYFVQTDTSHSPVEGNHLSRLDDSTGLFESRYKTKTGMEIIVEAAPPEALALWRASADPKLQLRAEAIAKVGLTIAEGPLKDQLILGFGVKDVGGQKVADYETVRLIRQDGHSFSYESRPLAEIRPLRLNTMEMDWGRTLKNTRDQLEQNIELNKKEVLTEDEFRKIAEGKEVLIIAGPAESSMGPLLRDNPAAVQSFLDGWQNLLRNWPLEKELIVVGGGTKGLESMMTTVLNKVNAERAQQRGAAIQQFGLPNTLTHGPELDPGIARYVITGAYSWVDAYQAGLSLVKSARPSNVLAFFAGGGGIIRNGQIPDAIAAKADFARQKIDFQVVLTENMSPSETSLQATDATIREMRKNGVPEGVSVISADAEGTFRVTEGHVPTSFGGQVARGRPGGLIERIRTTVPNMWRPRAR